MEQLKIQDIMGGIEGFFFPKINYPIDGELFFGYIAEASITKKGKNLAREYFVDEYYDLVKDAFKGLFSKIKLNYLCYKFYNENNERKLIVSPVYIFYDILVKEFGFNYPVEIIGEKNLLDETFKSSLKDIRKRAKNIINGNAKIENDPQLYKMFQVEKKHFTGKNIMGVDKQQLTKLTTDFLNGNIKSFELPLMSFENSFLSNVITVIDAYLEVYDNVYEVLEKHPINFEKLSCVINFDKFYLALAKQFMVTCKENLKDDDTLSYSAIFLSNYKKAVYLMKENSDYNPTITFTPDLLNVKDRQYSVNQFLKEFDFIIKKYPDEELRLYNMIDENDGNDYTKLDNVEKEIDRLKKKEEMEVLIANWNLIPKGEVEKKVGKQKSSLEEDSHRQYLSSDNEEEKLEVKLENTNYSYWLEGKDKFMGYRGFLYQNGYILFEKVKLDKDDNYKAYRVKDSATYLMNLTNFTQMSKLPISEILGFIKAGSTDVQRIYHTSKWEEKVAAVEKKEPYFDTNLYPDGILNIIKGLIDAGEMVKETKSEYKLNLNLSDN